MLKWPKIVGGISFQKILETLPTAPFCRKLLSVVQSFTQSSDRKMIWIFLNPLPLPHLPLKERLRVLRPSNHFRAEYPKSLVGFHHSSPCNLKAETLCWVATSALSSRLPRDDLWRNSFVNAVGDDPSHARTYWRQAARQKRTRF